jgi:hypothetical protein
MKDEEVEKGLAQVRAASLQAALEGNHEQADKLRAVHEVVDRGRNTGKNTRKK